MEPMNIDDIMRAFLNPYAEDLKPKICVKDKDGRTHRVKWNTITPERPNDFRDVLQDGVVVYAGDPDGPVSDMHRAVYLFNQYYPVTDKDVDYWKCCGASDVCFVKKLKDKTQLNELFWGHKVPMETIWHSPDTAKSYRAYKLQKKIEKLQKQLDSLKED